MNWKKFGRRFLRVTLAVVLLAAVGIFILAHSLKFRISDEDAIAQMSNDETEVSIQYLDRFRRKTRSIHANKGNSDLLILLHGSPSSSAQWVPMVNDSELSEKVDFLMIDRPGYGYSSFGDPLLSVEKVAAIIQEISDEYRDSYEKIYVLGTSYGGTVAARLLMDYPGFFDAGVLISSSLAPGEENTYGISYFMDRVPWLFPTFLMVANDEKLDHINQLEAMESNWNKISDPIFFIHSTTDNLVYPANVEFALERIKPDLPVEVFWVPNADHSLFWSERELFFKKVNEFVDGKVLSIGSSLVKK